MTRYKRFVKLLELEEVIGIMSAHAGLVLVIRIALIKENRPQVSDVILDEFCTDTTKGECNTIRIDGPKKVTLLSSEKAVNSVLCCCEELIVRTSKKRNSLTFKPILTLVSSLEQERR